MKKEIKNIDILELLLDIENARYGGDTVSNQREAVLKMFKIKDMDKKIYTLAEHISEHGLDPTELPLVFSIKNGNKKTGQYCVVEGNRRVLAMKLLHNPNLSPSDSYRKKLENLTSHYIKRNLSNIQCSVVADRKSADVWIDLKHTGENDGAGRVNWDGTARDAFRLRAGKKKTAGRQILDYIDADNRFSPELSERIKEIGITNIGRFFQGSPAKNAFGLFEKNGRLVSSIPLNNFREIVEYVIELMLEDDFSVKNIYTKKDQEHFIKEKIPEAILPTKDSYLKDSQTWSISNLDTMSLTSEQKSGRNSNKKKNSGRERSGVNSKPQSKNRSHLIDFSLKVTDKRINEIYRELKSKLNVHDSPNAVSVLFRVFLELTCDYYFEANKIKRTDNNKLLKRDDSLKTKVEHVANYLEKNNDLTKSQARAIRNSASSQNELVSVSSLNQYIHASELSPIPTELNRLMDNWAHLFKAIWK